MILGPGSDFLADNFQVEASPAGPAAVPDPATWLLALTGLLLLGSPYRLRTPARRAPFCR